MRLASDRPGSEGPISFGSQLRRLAPLPLAYAFGLRGLRQDFSVAEGLEVMKEAKALGLDSWEALDGLAAAWPA